MQPGAAASKHPVQQEFHSWFWTFLPPKLTNNLFNPASLLELTKLSALGGRLSPRTHKGIRALQSFCALSHADFGNPSAPLGVRFTRTTDPLKDRFF
jgi:hypothetical protein